MHTIRQRLKIMAGLCTAALLIACSNDESVVKQAADGAARGADNLIEGVKQMPGAIGEAANKVQDDIDSKGDDE